MIKMNQIPMRRESTQVFSRFAETVRQYDPDYVSTTK